MLCSFIITALLFIAHLEGRVKLRLWRANAPSPLQHLPAFDSGKKSGFNCLPRAHHRSHKSKSLLTSQSDSARDITYSKLWKSLFLQMSIATKPPFIYRRKWVCKGKCVHTGLHGFSGNRLHDVIVCACTHTHTLLTCHQTCKQCVCICAFLFAYFRQGALT